MPKAFLADTVESLLKDPEAFLLSAVCMNPKYTVSKAQGNKSEGKNLTSVWQCLLQRLPQRMIMSTVPHSLHPLFSLLLLYPSLGICLLLHVGFSLCHADPLGLQLAFLCHTDTSSLHSVL